MNAGILEVGENQGDVVASGLEPYSSWEAFNLYFQAGETDA